jgi:hypothetical protein
MVQTVHNSFDGLSKQAYFKSRLRTTWRQQEDVVMGQQVQKTQPSAIKPKPVPSQTAIKPTPQPVVFKDFASI